MKSTKAFKPSKAGLRVLRAFDRRKDDVFEIDLLSWNDIRIRAKAWRSLNRTIEVLEREGLIASVLASQGYLYSRTSAGESVIQS